MNKKVKHKIKQIFIAAQIMQFIYDFIHFFYID